jgi:hypothetical protein
MKSLFLLLFLNLFCGKSDAQVYERTSEKWILAKDSAEIKLKIDMKTYIVTQRHIELLKDRLITEYSVITNWEESLDELPKPKKLDLNWSIPEDFYTNRAKYFVTLELDKDRTEFYKFIEDNKFIKPEQPYYVKDGVVFDYSDLRELFLESKK